MVVQLAGEHEEVVHLHLRQVLVGLLDVLGEVLKEASLDGTRGEDLSLPPQLDEVVLLHVDLALRLLQRLQGSRRVLSNLLLNHAVHQPQDSLLRDLLLVGEHLDGVEAVVHLALVQHPRHSLRRQEHPELPLDLCGCCVVARVQEFKLVHGDLLSHAILDDDDFLVEPLAVGDHAIVHPSPKALDANGRKVSLDSLVP